MTRFVWHARHLSRRIGWAGLAGMLLMLVMAVAYRIVMIPLEQDVNDWHRETLRLRSSANAHRALHLADQPGGDLQQFYAFFNDKPGMEEALQRIYDAAAQENVQLEQGEYRLASEREGHLARYDIGFPVKGPYPQLRRFIGQALKAVPSLALDGVSFTRPGIADSNVEARLRLTLYLPADE